MGLWLGQWAGVLFGALLGGTLASFGCVLSERVPAGRSVGGRSACACGRALRGIENTPVLGWVVTRGRARCCGIQIPARYVLWEAAYASWGAFVLGWAWHRWTQGALTVDVLALAAAGFALFFVALVAGTWQKALPPGPDEGS